MTDQRDLAGIGLMTLERVEVIETGAAQPEHA